MIPPKVSANVQSSGLTLAEYSARKKLPVSFLEELGLSNRRYASIPSVRIPYVDSSGCEKAVRYRINIEGDRFRWQKGTKPMLYGLNRLSKRSLGNTVVLVEGESDAQTLWFHGEAALGLPGASSWKDVWADALEGFDVVYVVVEPDKGGETLVKILSRSAIRARLKCIHLDGAKDVNELHAKSTKGFADAWQRSKASAKTLVEEEHEQVQPRFEIDTKTCAHLAQAPNILDLVSQAVADGGFAGERRNVRLLYLILTSRLLSTPVSAVIKGPSAAGKSQVVKEVLKLFPRDAFYELSAMSERALIYSQEPLIHRVLVIFEAAGLNSDLATYLTRSLLSEGRIRYETVDKTPNGPQPRLIEREGPTSLLTTTTSLKLHAENETRLISLHASDSAEQTRAVLIATADAYVGAKRHTDMAPWHALQRVLAHQRAVVVVPFADAIAKAIKPAAVRLRRDFRTVLTLVCAHALLHQANRGRDHEGRIIALLHDYAAVYALMNDLVSEGVGASIAPAVIETVKAVAEILAEGREPCVVDVAQRLNLDTSSAHRRVSAAIRGGYIEDVEPRHYRRKRLQIGLPLPAGEGVLPAPCSLQVCSEFGGDDDE